MPSVEFPVILAGLLPSPNAAPSAPTTDVFLLPYIEKENRFVPIQIAQLGTDIREAKTTGTFSIVVSILEEEGMIC